MAAYFFDSSALVKRHAKETGTAWVFSLVRPSADNRLYLARITGMGAGTLTLISADNALNSAAIAEGLAVDNPNHHP